VATIKVERFRLNELINLRTELLSAGRDSFQAAQVVSLFLAGRGYGIGAEQARDLVMRLGYTKASCDHIQRELERVALVM
jgi:hypothetical protein